MKVFITGLCLQGNKGGPALALSLIEQIKSFIPDAEFVFSVPGGKAFEYEEKWAKIYGVHVVDYLPLVISHHHFRYPIDSFKKVYVWFKTLANSDVVLDMTAISYVGPPVGQHSWLLLGRARVTLFCLMTRKKLIAWTQSYGPFSTKLVSALAKWDLKRQPMIFCRGNGCLNAVRALLPSKQAGSFPDVATLLPFDINWGRNYLNEILGFSFEKLVTISPSAVIYGKSDGVQCENKHVKDMTAICKLLSQKGYRILLVPHTKRNDGSEPKRCDFAVSKVVKSCSDIGGYINIVNEDLSPIQLKSIISNAYIHVGGRYHSLVAALSSNVPGIALSWHPKYQDLMSEYGISDYVFDSDEHQGVDCLKEYFESIEENYSEIKEIIINRQQAIRNAVQENTRLIVNLL